MELTGASSSVGRLLLMARGAADERVSDLVRESITQG